VHIPAERFCFIGRAFYTKQKNPLLIAKGGRTAVPPFKHNNKCCNTYTLITVSYICNGISRRFLL